MLFLFKLSDNNVRNFYFRSPDLIFKKIRDLICYDFKISLKIKIYLIFICLQDKISINKGACLCDFPLENCVNKH